MLMILSKLMVLLRVLGPLGSVFLPLNFNEIAHKSE